MSRCQDKLVTHRWLTRAGLNTPSYRVAGRSDANVAFLEKHGSIVVKPAVGEQGRGITVGVTTPEALEQALAKRAAITTACCSSPITRARTCASW
jgi:glutathione synthase/RimK-type ligase-like ATP-grasp enzyme